MSVIKNQKDSMISPDTAKKERKEIILNILKDNPNGQTITDIKNAAYGPLRTVGEKTLQRELVAMVAEGVLKKTGTKRWSRYFLI
jgi:predicted transcriptional regulator